MGGTNWSSASYRSMSSSFAGRGDDDVFKHTKTRTLSNEMSPFGLKFRECRDSAAHPETFGIKLALDETGSMGDIPSKLVRGKLQNLMGSLVAAGVNDAQVLFEGIGDVHSDKFPLQVGQFESGDTELVKWLTEINLEGNGGGHGKEDYELAWLVAARHTSLDCFEKRGIKGICFTVGDEKVWESLSAEAQKKFLGYSEASDISSEDLLREASRMYHIFHIHVIHDGMGSRMDGYNEECINDWKKYLGERVIVCNDYNTIAEIVATTAAMIHGIDMEEFTKQFDDSTATSVKNALVKADIHVATRKKAEEGIIKL
jgi:hypothetical protein